MATEQNTAFTILAIDLGTAHTRASLFDVVEDTYRFIGHGQATTTIYPPYNEASEGMRHAVLSLQAATGRALLDEVSQLIVPSNSDGNGADIVVVTSSAGPPLRAAVVGLLPEVSLQSAQRLSEGTYLKLVEAFSLGDRRKKEQQIDAVRAAKPHIIIAAGGTDGGAQEALLSLIETVVLGAHLLAATPRTRLLFAGNKNLQDELKNLQNLVTYYQADNVVPHIGVENLAPARQELTKAIEELRLEQVGGLMGLAQVANGPIMPTIEAEGQLVRFLSRLPDWPRGVLAVNVGSAYTTLAAAFNGHGHATVHPDLGLGVNVAQLLKEQAPAELLRWLPFAASEDEARALVLNKSFHPHTVPADENDLFWELALARSCVRLALRQARTRWLGQLPTEHPDLLPWLSLIIGGGAALSANPNPGLAALNLLDALQPIGLTRLWLDPYHIAASLGALAALNPLAVAHLHEAAFMDLGTAVSVLGRGRINEVAGEVSVVTENGKEHAATIKFGTVARLPLRPGQAGKLTLKPRAAFNFGFGTGRSKTIPIKGGLAGILVDARGRPLAWPKAPEKRREFWAKWLKALGWTAPPPPSAG